MYRAAETQAVPKDPLPIELISDPVVSPDTMESGSDPFLYHVTSNANAASIMKVGFGAIGTRSGRPHLTDGQRTFFTARNGVALWQKWVATRLTAQGGDGDVAVLRVPMVDLAQNCHPDVGGTAYAGAPVFSVPTDSLLGRQPTAPLTEEQECMLAAAVGNSWIDPDLLRIARARLRSSGALGDLGFERHVQVGRDRLRKVRALLGDGSQVIEFAGVRDHADPTQLRTVEVFSRETRADAAKGRKWRLTTFRPDGPCGHVSFRNLDDVAMEILSSYDGELATGVVDAWAMQPQWLATQSRQNQAPVVGSAPAPEPRTSSAAPAVVIPVRPRRGRAARR